MKRTNEIVTLLKSINERVERIENRLNAQPEELVDTHKAAEILGTTVGAVRQRVNRGNLPCKKIGPRLRFRVGTLYNIINGNE